ncbi:ATP-binding protein [Amycolatopsis sp. NPDC005003]
MTGEHTTGNAISGSVAGSVVQAGTVRQVILPQPQHPRQIPRQLPPGLRDFAGRAEQIAALDALLPPPDGTPAGATVAVVSGTGGAGKTSLAIHWAQRAQPGFPDGTLFADLRGYGPAVPLAPELVLTSFLSALGVSGAAVPAQLDDQAATYRSVLAERRVLVVLDNAIDAGQVQPLLPGAPGCMTIVTSRNVLAELMVFRAARLVTVEPFTGSQALAFLRGLVGSDRTDAEPEAVAELIRVCGGLPLAVRIAATRAIARPHDSLVEVAADITARRAPATRSLAGAMRSVFDWSYARLPAAPARVFRLLGLHPGPEFGVRAAAALAALDPATTYDCLEMLAERHLIEPIGNLRYRIHDLLHAYAAGRAEDSDPIDQRRGTTRRVLTWYAAAVQHADRAAFPALAGVTPTEVVPSGELPVFAGRAEALAWLSEEQATAIAAVHRAAATGLPELVTALAASLRFLSWQGPGLSRIYLELLSSGLTAARFTGPRALETLFHVLRGETLWSLGRLEEAENDYAAALELAEDPARRVDALAGLGWVRLAQERLEEARRYYLAALPLSSGLCEGRTEAVVHANLSRIHTRLGDFPSALRHADRELALRRQAHDEPGEAYALHTAALARQGMGEHATAIRLCRHAIGIHRTLGDHGRDLAEALLTLSASLERTGQVEESAAGRREASAVLASLGDSRAAEIRPQRGSEGRRQPPTP